MNNITNKTKKIIYYLYILVVIILFLFIYMDIVGNNSVFTSQIIKIPSSTAWIIICMVSLIVSYMDLTTGILCFIIFFSIMKLRVESFISIPNSSRQLSSVNIPDDSDKGKVIGNIIEQLKTQNPDMILDDNYYNYLYDKYFNDEELLRMLTTKRSCRLVSDLESSFLIPYNLIEEDKLKQNRSNWSRLDNK
jgi:hypothetical protein